MGQYLIPGDLSRDHVSSAIGHLREQGLWTESQVWDWGVDGGILFTDPSRTDAQCAALYAGFSPVEDYSPPLPAAVKNHLQHLRDYLNASPATITNAQTVHVVQDLIRAVHYLNKRFEEE